MVFFYLLARKYMKHKNMETKPNFNFKGVGSSLKVYDDRVQIKPKGLLGVLGGQGGETIFLKDMTSVVVRECSFFHGGHIQFSAPGTKEENNRIEFGGYFGRKSMNENAKKIKAYVIHKMQVAKTIPATIHVVS